MDRKVEVELEKKKLVMPIICQIKIVF